MRLKAIVNNIDTDTEWSEDPPFGDERHYMTLYLNVGFRAFAYQAEDRSWQGIKGLTASWRKDCGEHDLARGLVDLEKAAIAGFNNRCYPDHPEKPDYLGNPDYPVVIDIKNLTLCSGSGEPPVRHYTITEDDFGPWRPFFEMLLDEMYRIAGKSDIIGQVDDTWRHSAAVWKLAERTATIAARNGREIDFELLEKGSFAHDLGRMYTGSPASENLEPNYMHGLRGYEHFMDLDNDRDTKLRQLPQEYAGKLARICMRHMGGSGFVANTNQSLGLGQQATLAETIEERIIGYADWRIHAFLDEEQGVYMPRIVTEEESMARSRKLAKGNNCQLRAVEDMVRYIHEITNYSLKG